MSDMLQTEDLEALDRSLLEYYDRLEGHGLTLVEAVETLCDALGKDAISNKQAERLDEALAELGKIKGIVLHLHESIRKELLEAHDLYELS